MSCDKNNNNSAHENTFYILPRYIRKTPGMTLFFLDVYEQLFQFWNRGKTCFLSNDALAARIGSSIRQVKEALTFFERNGLLIREKRGTKRYLIQTSKIEIEDDDGNKNKNDGINVDHKGATAPRQGRSTALTKGATAPHNINKININNREREQALNSHLEAIRTSNPLSAVLSDKYLIIQHQSTQDCLKDKKAREIFDLKFGQLEITLEEMLWECIMFYAMKEDTQYVSPHRFRSWIKREHTDIYDKKPDSLAHKLWKDLTEEERDVISEYKHFERFPDISNTMREENKNRAKELLKQLNQSQRMKVL